METAIATERQSGISAATLEQVFIGGDLSKLSPSQRVEYYATTCQSLGLNPLTKPFDYIILNGKMVLYAKRDATDQLRRLHGVSIIRLERERIDDVYVVTAFASMADGRQDSSIGAVNIKGLQGDALANALMKAETKSKRRVTLSICGLGMLDETEMETIPSAVQVQAIPDDEPEPEGPAVTPLVYQVAKSVKNRDGVEYGDLPLDKLKHMRRSLITHLEKATAEERPELEYKLAAAESVIAYLTRTAE